MGMTGKFSQFSEGKDIAVYEFDRTTIMGIQALVGTNDDGLWTRKGNMHRSHTGAALRNYFHTNGYDLPKGHRTNADYMAGLANVFGVPGIANHGSEAQFEAQLRAVIAQKMAEKNAKEGTNLKLKEPAAFQNWQPRNKIDGKPLKDPLPITGTIAAAPGDKPSAIIETAPLAPPLSAKEIKAARAKFRKGSLDQAPHFNLAGYNAPTAAATSEHSLSAPANPASHFGDPILQEGKFTPNLKAQQAAAAPSTTPLSAAINDNHLSNVLGAHVSDNHNGTFYLTVPQGVDPQKYYDQVTSLMRKCGAKDTGPADRQKIGPLWNGEKVGRGVGASTFSIGADVLNQPGVMQALESQRGNFAALNQMPLDRKLSQIFGTKVDVAGDKFFVHTPDGVVNGPNYRTHFNDLMQSSLGVKFDPRDTQHNLGSFDAKQNGFTLDPHLVNTPEAMKKLAEHSQDFKGLKKETDAQKTLKVQPQRGWQQNVDW